MAYIIGTVLAVVISAFACWIRLDRDRAFYPTIMTVIASYYGLFAVMGGSMSALLGETAVMVAFTAVAMLGFKKNLWFVVAALVAHGGFDFFHGDFVANPGVPAWWPSFCLTYDVTAAAFLAWRLRQTPRLAA